MNLYQFIALGEMEQAEAIWTSTFLCDREEGVHKVLLYAIDDFYVEVFYHREQNVIHRFKPFKQPALLDPYLEQIDLGNLF